MVILRNCWFFNCIGETRVYTSSKSPVDLDENYPRSLCQLPAYIAALYLTAIQKYSIGALWNVSVKRAEPLRNCICGSGIICTTRGWRRAALVANTLGSWFAVAMATGGKLSRGGVKPGLHEGRHLGKFAKEDTESLK